jgi:hypothetical protein
VQITIIVLLSISENIEITALKHEEALSTGQKQSIWRMGY